MTVRELIRKSALLIGALASGENLSADEGADGLTSLNELLESWSNDGLLLFSNVRESFNLVAGTAAYTIGSGATFNTSKPEIIEQVSIIESTIEYPCEIINVQRFSDIPVKTTQSQIPTDVYITDQATTKTLNFYPTPSEVNQCVIYSKKPLTAFTSLSESISLPLGYQRALRYDLARELSIEYGVALDPRIEAEARELKANLMRKQVKSLTLESDVIGLNRNSTIYNIYSGE